MHFIIIEAELYSLNTSLLAGPFRQPGRGFWAIQHTNLRTIHRMGEAGHAQFIVATHSPILLACPGARIVSFDQSPVREIAYEQTEYYTLYSSFMADPSRYLDDLVSENG